ncbi:phage distal tail protein [Micromonospora maritima]|uniref:phage distal tail protein n=1 Tax=Micromonospora maritima TaxID=986711 RepID=UPI001FEC1B56|nr:phage tail domain-containing protein [Micromonospora maritima]
MPLRAGILVPSPPTTTPQAPTTVPVTRDPVVGAMRATWADPQGAVVELTGPHEAHGWFTRPEVAGWGAAPVTLVTDPLPRGGVSVRHQRREPRRLTWPLHVYGDTHLQFLDRYRRLMRHFTLTKYRGAGTLTIYRPDGSDRARAIDCLYEDGFGGEPGENVRYANPTLTLFCPDGYFRAVDRQFIRRTYQGTGGSPYLRPYLTVSSSRTLGESTVFNGGDIEVYPSWTITGPAAQLVATNETTGESFTLTHNLLAGQTATITITADRALIRGHNGENLSGKLNFPGAVLWALLPGTNDVNFQVTGSGPGTQVELSFYPLYETA